MKRVLKAFLKFIPFAVAITCVFVAIIFEVQQNYRMSANDPQVQLAEDIASQIHLDKGTSNLSFNQQTDMASSLAAFVVIYDKDMKPTMGTGYLDGNLPTPPAGTFNATTKEPSFFERRDIVNGENRFTWQPKAGVRIATVLVPVDSGTNGYVLVGRSLKEVEIREDNLTKTALIAWVLTLLATFGSLFLVSILKVKVIVEPSSKEVKDIKAEKEDKKSNDKKN